MTNLSQNIMDEYKVWCNKAHASLQSQLKQYESDEDSLRDAFFQHLTFGTGGLRGIIGAGPNRMNIHTVARATQGLANYLNDNYDAPSVAIARDSRNMGEEFCNVAARVLAANNIQVHLYPRIEPTPALSFAVRQLHAQAGICMTASHNPAAYNGYKAYGADGCQITSGAARDISVAIEKCDIFNDVKIVSYERGVELNLINNIPDEVIEQYIDACVDALPEYELTPNPNAKVKIPSLYDVPLKVVYTPLHGAGLECVSEILKRINVSDVIVDEVQAKSDGNFPTCPYPNPEFREALEHSLELCEQVQPDLLIATDPDTDRVGIAVNKAGEFKLLTGNEVGILLTDFIMKVASSRNEDISNKVVMSTIVSSSMLDALSHEYGFELRRTLTGFKYVGEQIARLESAGCADRYAFGFEESYGYLPGTYVRDKDAVATTALICNMARFYKSVGIGLMQAMESLYLQFGFYKNAMVNMQYEGATGVEKMSDIMERLRKDPPQEIAGMRVIKFIDYKKEVEMPCINQSSKSETQTLPTSNVLEFQLQGENKVIVRPSGTEPKIKGYLFAKAPSAKAAEDILAKLDEATRKLLS